VTAAASGCPKPGPVAALHAAWSQTLPSLEGPVVGVGLDLVDVEQVADLIRTGGTRFCEDAWTVAEIEDANGDPERLAARWAAKEAVMKALGAGLGDIAPNDVEIRTDELGAPSVLVSGAAEAVAASRGVTGWCVSLTHESGWAAALVVALRDDRYQTASDISGSSA
jgi:holo-[acyl-carrier protein] synthase